MIHSKNDAKEIMINDKVNEVIGELFQSLQCNKMNANHGGSCIESS